MSNKEFDRLVLKITRAANFSDNIIMLRIILRILIKTGGKKAEKTLAQIAGEE